MTESEKRICDDVLRYGTIKTDIEFRNNNLELIRQYVIELDDEEYHMTKIDGEWSHFYHWIKAS